MNAWRRLADALQDDNDHFRVLTGLRGCAALWVFAYHAWHLGGMPALEWHVLGVAIDLTPPVALGGAGVTVFFVLSGFLLALPFARWQAGERARPAYGPYLKRRIARVFPAYYVQLALLLLLAPLGTGLAEMPDAGRLWRHALMLFVPPPLGTQPINGVWWTLPIEFSFYLLLPFLAWLLPARRWWWLLVGSLLCMWLWRRGVVTVFSDQPLPLRVSASYQLAGSFDMFGLGMLAAVAHVHWTRVPMALRAWLATPWAAFVGLGALIAASYWLAYNRPSYWADNPIFYLWTPLLSVGTVILVLAGLHGNRMIERLFANGAVVFSGVVSYSVYLWHLPVLHWLGAQPWLPAGGNWRFVALSLAAVPLTFFVSALSYALVERPAMRWAHGEQVRSRSLK